MFTGIKPCKMEQQSLVVTLMHALFELPRAQWMRARAWRCCAQPGSAVLRVCARPINMLHDMCTLFRQAPGVGASHFEHPAL